MKVLLVFAGLLLPLECLLWQWTVLPARVPVHFAGPGANAYLDKHLLIALVFVPLLIYGARVWHRPTAGADWSVATGAALFLSAVLCFLLVTAT